MDITETTLRTLGGLCELGGLIAVALGIADLRRRFSDRPPFFRALVRNVRAASSRAWARLRGRQHAGVVGGAVQVSAAATLRARAIVGPGQNMILEDKVAWLLRMVEQRQDTDNDLGDRIDSEKAERRQAFQDERTGREQAINELTEDIRTLATGDLTRQFWGAIAFGIGIILQVWSQELARFIDSAF